MAESKYIVDVAVQKFRIDSIDSATSTISAVFSIHLRWRDPDLSAEAAAAGREWFSAWEPPWQPRFDFSSEVEPIEVVRSQYKVDDEGFVRAFIRMRGRFFAAVHLHDFPLDSHLVSITASSLLPTAQCAFQRYAGGYPCSWQGGSGELYDWHVATDSLDVVCSVPPASAGPVSFSSFSLRFAVARRSGYYVAQIVLPTSLLVLSGCASVLMDVSHGGNDGLGDRLGYLMTLLLTLVAFRFVVRDAIPRVSYHTAMDRYLVVAFGAVVWLIAVTAAVSLIGHFLAGIELRYADVGVVLTTGLCWTVFHFWLLRRWRSRVLFDAASLCSQHLVPVSRR